jgi:glucosamine--fructose-6-phosphate aminotransferase (isomerizing)
MSLDDSRFPHWMRREIDQQPTVLKTCLESYLGDLGKLAHLRLPIADDFLPANLSEIQIIACGTSRHAGLIGQFWLEQLAQVPTRVRSGSEFLEAPFPKAAQALTIAVTQSGETADTLQALDAIDAAWACMGTSGGRCPQLGITNQPGSTLASRVDAVLLTQAGDEVGVAATKTFTAQLLVFYLLALDIAQRRGRLTQPELGMRLAELAKLPDQVQAGLELDGAIATMAQSFVGAEHCIVLGRGINRAIALEGALKLKETTYLHAEGYAAGEFMHGPLALLDRQIPVVAIDPAGAAHPGMIANLQKVSALGAPLFGILTAPSPTADLFDQTLILPPVSEFLSPFLTVLPLQLLAYHIAVQRGLNVDRPRHITKTIAKIPG